MKIIILGAGQVGSSLAENLLNEDNDITIIDQDTKKLSLLKDRLDIHTVAGLASHPDVLNQAGGADADMVIAVTNSDEVNMVACQLAFTLFHTPYKIARIRSSNYLQYEKKIFNTNSSIFLRYSGIFSANWYAMEHKTCFGSRLRLSSCLQK